MSYARVNVDDDIHVVVENLPNKKGRVVRFNYVYDPQNKDYYIRQRCLVCDKLLTEIKPKNGTVIKIKCKGCLVLNEITYTLDQP